jgi:gliding motility-associated-like protein
VTSGGNPPYTYSWNTTPPQNTQNATGLPAGNYNVFTPNHDGVNDVFTASGTDIKEFELIVYDRWGLIIFQTNDIQTGWNGILPGRKPALKDVYVYLIRAMDSQGVNHEYLGSVSLIR